MAKKKKNALVQQASILPPYAQILCDLGSQTTTETQILLKILSKPNLFHQYNNIFQIMAETMKTGWPDSEAAAVIRAVKDRIESGGPLDTIVIQQWMRAHVGDSNSVRDCIFTEPPENIHILRVLSRAGSQKLVFLANWQIAQREVVLKSFRGPDSANRILQRETQTHPLSMSHPNIIETHLLRNDKGEYFLVERRLPLVLNDSWRSNGIQEAGNLLRDILSALAFLNEQDLVHGDIKPDNIGFENGRYILLDFGICRPRGAFTPDVTPTGSLRTRAPELLVKEEQHSDLSDIWALGATVFNTLIGRFPLFRMGETPPRVSTPTERAEFEKMLCDRVEKEWNDLFDFQQIPNPIRPLLERMLQRKPEDRMKANDLLRHAENELSAVLRFAKETSYISPTEEINQLHKYLPGKEILILLPESQRREIKSKIEELRKSKGLTQVMLDDLALIESNLT